MSVLQRIDFYTDKFARLFLAFFIVFALSKLFFIAYFRADLSADTAVSDVIRVLLVSLRFDISAAALIVLPVLILSILVSLYGVLVFHRAYNYIVSYVYALAGVITIFLIILVHYYYYFYKDRFGVYFWEFWNEDMGAVTVAATYEIPFVQALIILVASWIVFLLWYWRAIIKRRPAPAAPGRDGTKMRFRAMLPLLLVLALLVGSRGTFGNPLPI